jgi:hypothetical protein
MIEHLGAIHGGITQRCKHRGRQPTPVTSQNNLVCQIPEALFVPRYCLAIIRGCVGGGHTNAQLNSMHDLSRWCDISLGCSSPASAPWSPIRPSLGLVSLDGACEPVELFFFGRAWMAVCELGGALDQECEHPIGLVPREWPVRYNSRHRNQYLSYPARNCFRA